MTQINKICTYSVSNHYKFQSLSWQEDQPEQNPDSFQAKMKRVHRWKGRKGGVQTIGNDKSQEKPQKGQTKVSLRQQV